MNDQKVLDQQVVEKMGRAYRLARVVFKNEVFRADNCLTGAGDVIALTILAKKIFEYLENQPSSE